MKSRAVRNALIAVIAILSLPLAIIAAVAFVKGVMTSLHVR